MEVYQDELRNLGPGNAVNVFIKQAKRFTIYFCENILKQVKHYICFAE